jgi:hypothetical protein
MHIRRGQWRIDFFLFSARRFNLVLEHEGEMTFDNFYLTCRKAMRHPIAPFANL